GRWGMTANDVRPGLSGWAQINGRDTLGIVEKAQYDGAYVQHFGFAMDCRCCIYTVGNVIHHKDVLEGGTGSKKRCGEAKKCK
ncbi:MAG: sugar transferase, partial [Clostridia bacterium]